ncbi:MAG: hypothetical protein COV76_05660 [Candidatus Omnitrophica bacterium CG11_big_fil_rev_8_21_14_0_20_64_10]|nr:MAG: hypothetical protein COV76_05660 [Candidatus Omnitrophica bacterium CG11_big_fil_rev_8_21_14_0_20_64_10]
MRAGVPVSLLSRRGGRGFTLVELLITVLIIGLVSTVAFPSYQRMLEGGRVKESRAVLASIYEAERLYRLDNGAYGGLPDLLGRGYLMEDPDTSTEWSYAVTFPGAGRYNATATRQGGGSGYAGTTVTINETETYGGTHPLWNK